MDELTRLETAIEHLESQRDQLGDAVVDAAVAPLQEKISEIKLRGDFPERQRKLVTILFSDIVGSTKVASHLDPEDTRDIYDTSLQLLAKPVEEHNGRVTRFMGDGFKAVFGSPQAHENDPEQAVRAGLGILEVARDLAKELKAERQIHDFQVRVGINTGFVAVGGETESGDTLMGSAVNLATRIESAAPPGGILISHDTYRHVRGIFDVQLLEPITAKGFDQPVPVYQITRAKDRPLPIHLRGIEGIETRMVGRGPEFVFLQGVLRQTIQEGKGRIITIFGEAGVGKSRLLYEFDNWIEFLPPPAIYIFQGRGQQEIQQQPFTLLRDVFAHRFEINDSDSNEIVMRKFETGFAEVLGSGEDSKMRAHLIGQLLGHDFSHSPYLEEILDEPQLLRDRGTESLIEFFSKLSKMSTVVVYLEDFQWADESSISLVEQLGHLTQQLRLLIICATRSTIFERHPAWGKNQESHTLMELRTLTESESDQLVDEILIKVEQVPDSLREIVVGNAEGNPFYIEELIKVLIENGAIVKGEDRWWVETKNLLSINVPSTLTGVLQSRLDSLPREERLVLQQASVVGRKFWDRSIFSINTEQEDGLGEQVILGSLFQLRDKEIIYPTEPTTFSGSREFEFKHAIFRDVTYESVLKSSRLIYHSSVANWLVQESGDRALEYAALIAEHFELAERRDLAIGYLLKAGDQAKALYALDEAERIYKKAVEILRTQGDDNQTARTLMNLGLIYLASFQPEKASQAYDEAFAFDTQLELPHNLSSMHLDPAVLHFAVEEPVTLDPGQIEDDASTFLAVQLFEGLVRVGMDSSVLPAVTARWEVDEDGQRYVFHLRDDALWNDGSAVTAHDFEFAWKRNLHPDSGSQSAHLLYPVKNAKAFREGNLDDKDLVGVRSLTEDQLEVRLERPTAYLPYLLAHPVTFPVPRKVVAEHGIDWTAPDRFLTNGSFQLSEWQKGHKMVLIKNPHYFGLFPGNAEQIECSVFPDYSRALAAFATGEVDVVSMVNADPDVVAEAQGQFSAELIPYSIPVTLYITFRTDKPPLDNPIVRQAFVHAVNRDLLVKQVFNDQRQAAIGGFIPPGLPAHSPHIGLPFDPQFARVLLKSAGYPNGEDFPPVSFQHGIGGEELIQFLLTSWRENLGIAVESESLPGDVLFDRLTHDPANISLTGWSADYPDPDNMLRVTFHSQEGFNAVRWQNASFDAKIEQAYRVTDHLQRIELYKEADRILIAEEAVVMPLTYGQRRMLAKSHIELPSMPHFQIPLKYIRIRKEVTQSIQQDVHS